MLVAVAVAVAELVRGDGCQPGRVCFPRLSVPMCPGDRLARDGDGGDDDGCLT